MMSDTQLEAWAKNAAPNDRVAYFKAVHGSEEGFVVQRVARGLEARGMIAIFHKRVRRLKNSDLSEYEWIAVRVSPETARLLNKGAVAASFLQ
jgi:hypothetical protein